MGGQIGVLGFHRQLSVYIVGVEGRGLQARPPIAARATLHRAESAVEALILNH